MTTLTVSLFYGTMPVQLPAEPHEYGIDHTKSAHDGTPWREPTRSEMMIISCKDGSVIGYYRTYDNGIARNHIEPMTKADFEKLPWKMPAYTRPELCMAVKAYRDGRSAQRCPSDAAGSAGYYEGAMYRAHNERLQRASIFYTGMAGIPLGSRA